MSHDKNILSYIKYALYRIDSLKTIFSKYRSQNITYKKDNKNKLQFNISKLHVIIYYTTFIRIYNSA